MGFCVVPPGENIFFPDQYLVTVFGATYTTAPVNMAAVTGGKSLIVCLKYPVGYVWTVLRVDTDQELAQAKIDTLLQNETVQKIWLLVDSSANLPGH